MYYKTAQLGAIFGHILTLISVIFIQSCELALIRSLFEIEDFIYYAEKCYHLLLKKNTFHFFPILSKNYFPVENENLMNHCYIISLREDTCYLISFLTDI